MVAFSQVLDFISVSVLFSVINVAVAATVIAAVALTASRWRGISFPVRHAICVCGIVGTIVAPLLVILMSEWAPRIAEITVHDEPPAVLAQVELTATREPASREAAAIAVNLANALPANEPSSGSHQTVAANSQDSSGSTDEPFPVLTGSSIETATAFIFDYFTVGKVLILAWIVGSLMFLMRRIVAEFRLRRWLAACNQISDLATLQAVELASKAVGLRKQPTLLQSKTLPAPVVCGFLRPRLVLPELMANGMSRGQLVAILSHEIAHLVRHDLATGLCLTIARIVYWWNPLIRILCNRTEDLGEQICDDIATVGLQQPRDYATALLCFAERATSFVPQPTSLGLSMSSVSQLEVRVRRILQATKGKSLRVSSTTGVIVVLMTTLLVAAASMIQIHTAQAQSPTPDAIADPAQTEQPSLDELLKKIEMIEQTYVPFQISVAETMRVNEELTPEQRNGVRYADGREHKRLMEHGVLERKVWFRSETSETDGVRRGTDLSFADGKRNVQARTNQVYIDENADDLIWFDSNSPLMGIVPLSTRSDGDMFPKAVRDGKCSPALTWDGDDAVLEFSLGDPNFRSEYQWTLSRKYDWHPIRLKTWLVRNEEHEQISDWAATELVKDKSGNWRVEKGSIGYFSWGQKPRLTSATGVPMPYYFVDFVVESATYGDEVDRQKFKYEIPANASIRTAEKVKPQMRTVLEDRELLVTVVNANGDPIVGATVRTSTDGQELEVLTTSDSGQVTSKKRGADSVSVTVEAAGFRPANIVVGGAPSKLKKIIMMPKTVVTVVDEDGKALGGIFVGAERFASMQLDFDRNGFPERPNLDFGTDPKLDRTTDDGHFQLTNDITLRTLEEPVPLWAVSNNGDRFGWMWVAPVDLDQPQTLVLKRTALVEAAFLLKQQTPGNKYSWRIQDGTGSRIAIVQPNLTAVGKLTLCHLKFRLPPGNYFLHREDFNGASSSVIGFTVPPDQTQVDLELVAGMSDAIDSDPKSGSVYGRIQVTNPQSGNLRPLVLVPTVKLPHLVGNVLSEDVLVDPETGGLEGAFVYLPKAPAEIDPDHDEISPAPLSFDMLRGCFVPHTMVISAGQHVELINSDPVSASFHTFPMKNQAFNHVVAPGTKSGSGILVPFKRGESQPFRVSSDFHPWMSAYWLVIDHPYAAITDKHGRFVIQNLPPGTHTFRVWHERMGLIERNLEIPIEPGQITTQPTISVDAAAFSRP